MGELIPEEVIERKIFMIRGHKVMVDKEEMENWKSQIVTSNREKMGIRKKPYVFTEQGAGYFYCLLYCLAVKYIGMGDDKG